MRLSKPTNPISQALAIAVLSYWISISALLAFSFHVHVLSDGNIIVHSHMMPIGGNGRNHSHSSNEYVIHNFALKPLISGAILVIIGTIYCLPFFYVLSELKTKFAFEISISSLFKRGPPFFLNALIGQSS